MGNPQHLDWLLEGVEAWNARRKREDFVPDLSGMDIRGAFEKAGKLEDGRIPLSGINFANADLRGVNLRGADLASADLGKTNLSAMPPAHKPGGAPKRKGFDGGGTAHMVRREAVRRKLYQNCTAIPLSAASLLIAISEYRFSVYSNNQLAASHPSFREGLLAFLDTLANSVGELLEILPSANERPDRAQAENVASWLDRFIAQWRNGEDYFAPENLADASKPVSVVLGCGTLGALLGLPFGGPIGATTGFGAGSVFGQMVTKHLKPGAAADKVAEIFENPEAP
ncbi:pentapeptide repeat-containing protein [Rhodovulum sulfidophilum]|nr:pentapeptide repeat-containing protein [Rhodovulum sulfidophilum]